MAPRTFGFAPMAQNKGILKFLYINLSNFNNLRVDLKKILILWILFPFFGCNSQEVKLVKETRFLMGTLFDITVSHPDAKKAKKAIEKAFDEIQRIEYFTSQYLSKSEVTKINQHAGGNAYPVSDELYTLLRKSIQYSQLTKGTFDITIGAVKDLWNFENGKGTVPSSETLIRLLPLVDFKNILLEKNYHVRLKKNGMKLDLGAIAKGYAVDRGLEILKKNQINNAIVNGGGDLKCIGQRSPGSPWKIGVRHPRKTSAIISSLEGNNIAMATSGDYQKYFIKDGIRYHHLLDPATGMPAQGLQSVTIITKEAIFADAMTTAVFVMGANQGLKFIEAQKQLEGIIITADGGEIISSGLKGAIETYDYN